MSVLPHGIGEQAVAGGDALGHLVLERVTLQQAHGRDAGEDPRQLGDLGNIGLPEEYRPGRIEPQRQVAGGHMLRVLDHRLGVIQAGQGVIVGDEVETVVAALHLDLRGGWPRNSCPDADAPTAEYRITLS